VDSQCDSFGPVRFTTDDLPERDRVPVWRELFGRFVFHTEFEPAPDVSFHADVTVRGMPSLHMVSSTVSPVSLARPRTLVADGNDDIGLCLSSSNGTFCQLGREVAFGPGDAVMAMAAEPSTWTVHSAARVRALYVRRSELAPLVADLDPAAVLGRVMPDSEPLRYLLGYLRFLEEQQSLADTGLAQAAAIHLRDLLALVLGATRDAAVLAKGRGLAAVRLHAIKRFVAENLGDGGLTVGTVAARFRVTPRYVQRLFEREGTTFSEFLLNQRLAHTHRMLADPHYAGWRVSAIALEAGFGDVSYFNRCFRRRFGASPTEFRGP
jgi:AraC-like DNA-binding protein